MADGVDRGAQSGGGGAWRTLGAIGNIDVACGGKIGALRTIDAQEFRRKPQLSAVGSLRTWLAGAAGDGPLCAGICASWAQVAVVDGL